MSEAKIAKSNGKTAEAPVLSFDALVPDETRRMRWYVAAPPVLSPKDLESSAFWSVASQSLSMYDEIFVVSKDASWCATYIVTDKWQGGAAATLLWSRQLPPRAENTVRSVPEGYEVVQTGPGEMPGWVARRKKDGHPLVGGDVPRPTFEACLRELLDHAIFRTGENTRYYA